MSPLTLYRLGRRCYLHGIPLVPGLVYRLNFLLFNCVIPMSTEIGEGTELAYGGMGVLLHPRSRIGRNVLIAQQVTVGGRSRRTGVPVIEDDCYIGAGARIIGPIRIGAGSVVGANAVVIEDVPPRSVVAGVPARVIRTEIDIAAYRSDREPAPMAEVLRR